MTDTKQKKLTFTSALSEVGRIIASIFTMKRVQMFAFLSAIIISSLFFIYALGFLTNWALGEWLTDYFAEAQRVNHILFTWTLYTLVAVAVNIFLNSHSNNKLFMINFVVALISIVLMVITGYQTLKLVIPLKTMYLEQNEAIWAIVHALNDTELSTKTFDIGVKLAYLSFIDAGFLMMVLVLKFVLQLKSAKAKRQRILEATR